MTRTWLSRRLRGDRGAAAVEFALVVPLLVALVFGLIDFGRAYNEQITLTQLAREGARLVALNQADYATRLVTAAPSSLQLTATDITVVSSCTTASTPTGDATVKVTKVFTFIEGFQMTLTGKATMPCLG
jgi:Flp pilus assembly protein TadG